MLGEHWGYNSPLQVGADGASHHPRVEPFFPRMSPWKVALAWTFPVLSLLLIGISYIGWREHKAEELEIKKTKVESEERDQAKKEKEEACKARGKCGGEPGELEVQAKAGLDKNIRDSQRLHRNVCVRHTFISGSPV